MPKPACGQWISRGERDCTQTFLAGVLRNRSYFSFQSVLENSSVVAPLCLLETACISSIVAKYPTMNAALKDLPACKETSNR